MQLQRVQRDLRNVKSKQESLSQQNEDKENTIHQLKKDLRAMKEQLNEEKIRHRRSQVMQSRIPAPSRGRSPKPPTRKPMVSQKPSGLTPPTKVNTTATNSHHSTTEANDPNNVSRIRYRVLKMLKQYDPTKVGKIDDIMSKFEGRETELLEKMIARYETGKSQSKKEELKSATSAGTESSQDDSRPKSRQELAHERHMARMKRIKASARKE